MILIYYYIETNIKSDPGFKILINSHKNIKLEKFKNCL